MHSLNREQDEAVRHIHGPLLIVAGAGAGKTRVITHRIAHLIREGVPPEKILAVTFTNKAAREMAERVNSLLAETSVTSRPFISTFHSLGVALLKEHGRVQGLSRWFTIYDRDESKSLIRKACRETGVDPKQFEPGKILSAISRAKGELLTPETFPKEMGDDFYPSLVAKVWKRYEEHLKKANALDFDDLLLRAVRLLAENSEIRNYYEERFLYVHIDEYQDTNKAQYELSKLLAEKHKNICVVGDMDQNIYSWRGANLRNILNFERDYPGTKIVLLEENYRSTGNILLAANEVIKKNKLRKEKNLFTQKGAGEKISLIEAFDEQDEARHIAGKTKELLASGVAPEEIAILYRANFQSRVIEESFIRAGVPYHVLGVSFYERREVKDALAFIRAALNPNDFESIDRIINIPKRGIGEKTLALYSAGEQASLPPRMQEKLRDFGTMLRECREHLLSEPPGKAVKFVVERTGLLDYFKAAPDNEERVENVLELVSLAKRYDGLPLPSQNENTSTESGIEKLLNESALASEQDNLSNERKGVRLMTVHAAKGLEFRIVFIAGLESGLFPHTGFDSEHDREEEERRLFYVALTRAEEKLFLSYAASRLIFGERRVNVPSEFISDIPEHLLATSVSDPFLNSGGTNYLGDIIDF